MKEDLESRILDALYDHFQRYPGSSGMTFNELHKAANISPQNLGKMNYQIFSLKGKGWGDEN